MWTLKRSFSSRKPLETESLVEDKFLMDGCCLLSHSNYLNYSNKDCDWLILARFIRKQMQADATFSRLEKKFGLKM